MNVRLSNVNNELRCALHTPAPRQRRAGIPSHSHARKARRSPASRGSSSSHPQAVPRGTHTSPVRRPPTPDLLTLALPAEPARQNQRATSVPNIYKVTRRLGSRGFLSLPSRVCSGRRPAVATWVEDEDITWASRQSCQHAKGGTVATPIALSQPDPLPQSLPMPAVRITPSLPTHA